MRRRQVIKRWSWLTVSLAGRLNQRAVIVIGLQIWLVIFVIGL
ncbi:unnamed protein product [Arabidopsis halleri]